jgi:hypothetical protein
MIHGSRDCRVRRKPRRWLIEIQAQRRACRVICQKKKKKKEKKEKRFAAACAHAEMTGANINETSAHGDDL